MDIWSWVHEKAEQLHEAGEHRLCDIIYNLPGHCCDDEHDIVDAMYAEGLPLAKKAKEPWVEVFIRHWYLQSQVLTRNNAKGMLNEAIDLLELSHTDEAKGCPQRICAVQDLANCYGKADGPGFADERIAVSLETLSEIDPSWPCFTCIGAEYMSALIDDKRYHEAIREGDRLLLEQTQHDGKAPESIDEVMNTQSLALIYLGNYEEALTLLKSKPISELDGNRGNFNKLLQCLALAHLKRFDQVDALMPPLADIIKSHTYFNDWAEIQEQLVTSKHLDFSDDLANIFREMANKLIINGSYRCAFDQLSILTKLATANNYLFTAKLAIEKNEEIIERLNKDCGALESLKSDKVEFLKQQERLLNTEGQSTLQSFSSIEALFENEYLSNDHFAQHLEAFHEEHPSNTSAASTLAELYGDYYHKEKGLALIQGIYQQNETDPEASFIYGRYLLNEYGVESLQENLGQLLKDDIQKAASEDIAPTQLKLLWLFAHAYKHIEPQLSIDYFKLHLQTHTDHINSLQSLAGLYCNTEEYDKSIVLWNDVIEKDPENSDNQWDKLIPSSLNRDWKSIREACKALDITLEGDSGPIDQEMGSCRIRFHNETGSSDMYFAKRTGPVSCIIKEIKKMGEVQHYGKEVVFTPSPLNTLDQKDDDGYNCDSEGFYHYAYDAYRFIENTPSYTCFAIDGVHPGDENIKTLIEQLTEYKIVFEQRNGEAYMLEYEDKSGETTELPGFYAYALVPPNVDIHDLHAIFNDFSKKQTHPLIWPKLLEELKLVDELKTQSEIEQRYGM